MRTFSGCWGGGMGRADPGASYRRAACDPGLVPFPWSPGPGAPQVQPLPAAHPPQPPSRAPWHPQAVLDFSAALHEDDTALSQPQAAAPTRAASVSAQLLGPRDRRGVRLGSTRPVLSGGDLPSWAQGGPGRSWGLLPPGAQGWTSAAFPAVEEGAVSATLRLAPPTGLRRPHTPQAAPHGQAQAPRILFMRHCLGVQPRWTLPARASEPGAARRPRHPAPTLGARRAWHCGERSSFTPAAQSSCLRGGTHSSREQTPQAGPAAGRPGPSWTKALCWAVLWAPRSRVSVRASPCRSVPSGCLPPHPGLAGPPRPPAQDTWPCVSKSARVGYYGPWCPAWGLSASHGRPVPPPAPGGGRLTEPPFPGGGAAAGGWQSGVPAARGGRGGVRLKRQRVPRC